MSSLKDLHSKCNTKVKINFEGGDLSSDSGLLLINEFDHKIGFSSLISQIFKTNDQSVRLHKDDDNLFQKIYQKIAGYFSDDDSDELTKEPVLTTILDKKALASQPTMSRFMNRMDEDTMKQFDQILRSMRKKIYALDRPEMVLFDVDSTHFTAYGEQEESGYNAHYAANGFHPLLVYDGLNGDLLKAQLRKGTVYTSNGIVDFMQPLLEEYQELYPDTKLYLRGDSGFAVPELYHQLETNSVSYAIRLKVNRKLYQLAEHVCDELDEATRLNKIDYAVCYGEFLYQAGTWNQPRRVVVKVEKPINQLVYLHTFLVTNMDLAPYQLIQYYSNRGRMENFIKEGKSGFDFESVSSRRIITNANRLQISVLAYNLFNWFRRLVLDKAMRHLQIDSVRLKLIKIAARMVRGAGYITFKLCSSCPYQKEFWRTWNNIMNLIPKVE